VSEAVYEDGTVRGVIGRATGRLAAPETLRAPLTLAADGMHSKFHNRYGIVKTVLRRQRWGIAGHLAGVEGMEPYIEVFFQEGNEIYVAPLAGDLVLVAILVEKSGMGAFQGNLPGPTSASCRRRRGCPGASGRARCCRRWLPAAPWAFASILSTGRACSSSATAPASWIPSPGRA
jgi:hypothetical protein